MDLFYEQLIKRQKSWREYLRIVLCILGALIAVGLLSLAVFVPAIGFIIFVVCCGIIYVLYLLITGTNMEYEYSFTNGEMDVDKIVNVRSRKRLATVNAREIDVMATKRNHRPEFERYMGASEVKKIYACENRDAEDVYFVVFHDGEVQKMLLFNPNEKIRTGFRRYNPQRVFLDD